jgi:hypothetical protein
MQNIFIDWLGENPWISAVLIAIVGYLVERSYLEAVSYAAIFSLAMVGYQNTWGNYLGPFSICCIVYLYLRLKATGRRVVDPESIGDEYREVFKVPNGIIATGDAYRVPDGVRVDVLRCRIGDKNVADSEQEGYAVVRTTESQISYEGDVFHPKKGCSYEVLWVISDWRVTNHFPDHKADAEFQSGWVDGPLKMEIMGLWRRINPPQPTVPGADADVKPSHTSAEDERAEQEQIVRDWIQAQGEVAEAATS